MQRMIFTVKNYVSNQIFSDVFRSPGGKCVYTDFRDRFCIYRFGEGASISILYIHFCIYVYTKKHCLVVPGAMGPARPMDGCNCERDITDNVS